MAASSGAVFHRDGEHFVPTEIARGPWDPGAQHGGAPSALLARAIERHDPGSTPYVARLTVELLRPVPLRPLAVAVRTVRPGKRVQLVEASLRADDLEVARAVGLRLREKPLDLPPDIAPIARLTPDPDGAARLELDRVAGPSFGDAVEIAVVHGGPHEPGPAAAWFRLRVPIVAGEVPSPLVRVAAAADFGNGISSVVDWDAGWTFINPDLTVYLHRHPVGDWVGLDARTLTSPRGVGIAEVALWDPSGRIGRSVQSLLLDRHLPTAAP